MTEELKPGDVTLADLITMIDMVENHTDAINLADKLWPMMQARAPAQGKPTKEDFVRLQHDAGIPNPPTPLTYWYRLAMDGEGPHAYNWSDKPHRLVYDLCSEIERLAAPLAEIAPPNIAFTIDEATAAEIAKIEAGLPASERLKQGLAIARAGSPAGVIHSEALADWLERAPRKMFKFGDGEREIVEPDYLLGRDVDALIAQLRFPAETAPQEPTEALKLIKNRLDDLRSANDVLQKESALGSRDRSNDIRRNDREIRWLVDINTVLRSSSQPESERLYTQAECVEALEKAITTLASTEGQS